MKYVCLACEEEKTLDALSGLEWDALRKETLDYVDELRDGRMLTTDGPFAETKETLRPESRYGGAN